MTVWKPKSKQSQKMTIMYWNKHVRWYKVIMDLKFIIVLEGKKTPCSLWLDTIKNHIQLLKKIVTVKQQLDQVFNLYAYLYQVEHPLFWWSPLLYPQQTSRSISYKLNIWVHLFCTVLVLSILYLVVLFHPGNSNAF